MANKKEYILGTNEQELNRLQLQHQVWKSEAKRGWDFANSSVQYPGPQPKSKIVSPDLNSAKFQPRFASDAQTLCCSFKRLSSCLFVPKIYSFSLAILF